MLGKRSRLDEELTSIRQRLEEDPTNIELANHYWAKLADGDYRSGRYVIEAYREAALTSSTGAARLARAYRELFLESGEEPRRKYFDVRLIQNLRSYLAEMGEGDRVNVQWVLETIDSNSATNQIKT